MIIKELNNTKMNYILSYPENINGELPLIIYLHGAGERGLNIKHLYRHAIPKMVLEGREINAFVLCPQCPGNCVWDNIVFDIKELIDEIVANYRIDKTKISLTGSSMGGFGAYALALTFNNFFSCVAIVAGGSMSWRSSNLKNLPIKIYHGDKDQGVPIQYAYLMYEALKNINPDTTNLVIMEGYNHTDGIEHAYYDLDVIDYLLSYNNAGRTINKEHLHELF